MRATISLGPLGVNGGFAGGNGGRVGVRGDVTGWSASSARSNLRFLRSVQVDQLPKHGVAFTLTIGDLCSSDEYGALKTKLTRFFQRRLRVEHWHMVTEWQERGHPHLHGCIMLGPNTPKSVLSDLFEFWLEITAHLGTSPRAQNVKMITGAKGWFQYTAKHASRGFAHYQRMADSMPEGWDKTGRMWSRSKNWPVQVDKIALTREAFFELRRCVDRFARSEVISELRKARRFSDRKMIAIALARLRHLRRLRGAYGAGRSASECRGINEWVSSDTVERLVDHAMKKPSRWQAERVDDGHQRFTTDRFRIDVVKPDGVWRRESGDIPI
jgi:hypothetical protein